MINKAIALLASAMLVAAASHVAVAKSVTIDNPATNPAKTSSVDDPGRVPYQFSSTACSGPACVVLMPLVPQGKRLVIRHVSIGGNLTPLPALAPVATVVVFNGKGPMTTFALPLAGPSGNLFFAVDQPMLGFVDANDFSSVQIVTTGVISSATIIVSGYLLDCTVNDCAPIAP